MRTPEDCCELCLGTLIARQFGRRQSVPSPNRSSALAACFDADSSLKTLKIPHRPPTHFLCRVGRSNVAQ